MISFLNLEHEAFGLDIKDNSLRLVKLEKKGKFLKLASFNYSEFEPGIVVGGEIKNEEALSVIIKNACLKAKGVKLKTKYVVASLPETKSFLQIVQMPEMGQKDLQSAINFEVENNIPLPIETVYWDFEKIECPVNHKKNPDILIAASSKKTVDSYVSCLKKAGLLPLALEAESEAIIRSLVKKNYISGTIFIVDFGRNNTNFIAFADSSIRFTSPIQISSKNLTLSIAKDLNVRESVAEEMKKRFNIYEKKEKFDKDKRLREIVVPILNELASQIKKHITFYRTHVFQDKLNSGESAKIILCGGGSNLKGLTEFLEKETNLPVELANVWTNISKCNHDILLKEKKLSFATAIGLAIRGIDEK